MAKDLEKQSLSVGQIKPWEIVEEMKESYIDYAMSVIVSRALPDVRDGLKPVHRRILYAMHEMGLNHTAKFRKSATVVGECFIKDTLILTKKGLIPIQEIRIGDEVYTQNGLQKVIRLYEMPEKPLLKVILENGISNIVTLSQKFKVLTPDWKFEWKEAKDLTKNDYLLIKADYPEIKNLVELNKIEENQPQYLDENIAYLLGILISDGSVSNDYGRKKLPRLSFGLGEAKEKAAEKIVSIFGKEFNYTPTLEEDDYQYKTKSGKIFNNKRYQIRINRKAINEFFVSNFELKGFKAPTKKIPSKIFQSPPNVIFSFISGLIDGDGCVKPGKCCIQYASSSEKLIDGLLIILLHQGIFSSKYILKLKEGGYINGRIVKGRYQPYSLEVGAENALRLAKYLNLASKKKRLRIQEIIENEKVRRNCGFQYDIIPYAGKMLFGELRENHLGAGWYQDINGNKFRMGIKYPNGGCKIRYSSDLREKPLRKTQVIDWGIKEKLDKIGSPLFEFLNHIIENKIYFLKVASIKKVVSQKTYDFEVGNDHEFIANGMISHNCMGKFHPHGDAAIYDSLVRMAQDFSLRYPLIQGQGNFGSLDSDPPAAQRYCITGDSLVVTNRCLEKIGEVSTKEDISLKVLSFGGKVNIASKWFDSGIHPTIKIKTFRGYTLKGSINHPILTFQLNSEGKPMFRWRLLSEIKKGDFAVIDRSESLWPKKQPSLKQYFPKIRKTKHSHPVIHKLPFYLTPDLAFLLGAIIAEGYISISRKRRTYKIGFCNTDEEFINEFRMKFKKVFPDCPMYEQKRGPLGYGKKNLVAFEICSFHLVEFLRNLGVKIVSSKEKQIPHIIFHSTKESVAAFLKGFVEGDGSIYQYSYRRSPTIAFISISKKLLQEIQMVLLRFGIDSFLRFDKGRNNWLLFIRGRDNFELFKTIGFVSKEKQQRLNEQSQLNKNHRIMSKTDFIPFLSNYLREKYKIKGIKWVFKDWLKRHNLDRYPKLREYYSILKQFLEKKDLELVDSFLTNNYLFDKIVSVKTNGKERVYSFRVDSKCHSFVSNGFISHNTEARLSKIGEEMLKDIEKNTIDFADNYDATRKEPMVLPSPLPQLLLNGSLGIAVGMATNIPPHNLVEVCEALIYLIDKPKANVEDLFKFIQGPDFPTGGIIYNQKEILSAYSQGKGPIVIRGKVEIVEDEKKSRSRILISEIPFQVQKSSLVQQFANLVQTKKIDGIKDIRDESDREGMRIVIELSRDAFPQKILNRLYKFTDLQKTFHMNMLALVERIQPRVLNIAEMLGNFILHRKEVIFRRTKYDLEKAKERVHILEGLYKCLANIDAVIKIIKNSAHREEAQKNLIKKFRLTQIQVNAILETRLASLATLERKKIEDELKEIQAKIKNLLVLLNSPQKIKDQIKQEIKEVKEKFGDQRRTKVHLQKLGEINEQDLIPKEETIITLTLGGYIKRINPKTYKIQKRGGKGILGMKTVGEDIVKHFLLVNTHDDLLFFTDSGKVFRTPVYEIPEGVRVAKGRGLLNFLEISSEDKILSVLGLGKNDESLGIKYLVMVTKGGIIKKTSLSEFDNIRRSGLIAINLKKGDALTRVKKSAGQDEIILATKKGQAIRFKEKEIREMGRTARGNKGIRLKKGDEVIEMDIIEAKNANNNEKIKNKKEYLLVITENGYGKRTELVQYKSQTRGGSGVKTSQLSSKTGNLVTAKVLSDEEDLIAISQKGQVIRAKISQIPLLSRSTQGVRLMRLDQGDKITSTAWV